MSFQAWITASETNQKSFSTPQFVATVSSNRVRNAIAASRITATIPAATPKLANYSPMPHVLPANVVISPLVNPKLREIYAEWPNTSAIYRNFATVKMNFVRKMSSKSTEFPAKLERHFAMEAPAGRTRISAGYFGVHPVKNPMISVTSKTRKERGMGIAVMTA